MKKRNIVKKNQDFNRIIQKRVGQKNSCFIVYYQPSEIEEYRFGISVGTKIGNAVVRNKLKRQMRNIIDKYKNSYPKYMDYIIILRKSCLGYSYQELEKCFLNIMDKITLEIKEKQNAEKKKKHN